MSTAARRRLVKDFLRLQKDPPPGVSGAPRDDSVFQWVAVIFGPEGTVWEGGTFRLSMEFDENYPTNAPKIFHPNVYNDGSICLDILQKEWSSKYNIGAILTSIRSFLCDPNPSSPANVEASRLFEEDRIEYNRRVKEVVEKSWEYQD